MMAAVAIQSTTFASSFIHHRDLSSRKSLVPIPVKPVGALRCAVAIHARKSAVCASLSTAKVLVQGLHLDVTPAIKEYAETKVNKAVHNFEGAVKEIDVKLSASGSHGKGSEAHHQRHQTVEVTVYTLRHGVIRVEDTEEDLYAAIDLVTDKLKRKMTKLKEKAVSRSLWPGKGGPKGGDVIVAHIDPESSDAELPIGEVAYAMAPEIVREKVLLLEADNKMTAEEAVDQLEAVGHSFFVFQDAADGALKVVYRRKANGYGLLIPQIQS